MTDKPADQLIREAIERHSEMMTSGTIKLTIPYCLEVTNGAYPLLMEYLSASLLADISVFDLCSMGLLGIAERQRKAESAIINHLRKSENESAEK